MEQIRNKCPIDVRDFARLRLNRYRRHVLCRFVAACTVPVATESYFITLCVQCSPLVPHVAALCPHVLLTQIKGPPPRSVREALRGGWRQVPPEMPPKLRECQSFSHPCKLKLTSFS